MPGVKKYLYEMPDLVPSTLWLHTEVGHNDEAKREILVYVSRTPPLTHQSPSA